MQDNILQFLDEENCYYEEEDDYDEDDYDDYYDKCGNPIFKCKIDDYEYYKHHKQYKKRNNLKELFDNDYSLFGMYLSNLNICFLTKYDDEDTTIFKIDNFYFNYNLIDNLELIDRAFVYNNYTDNAFTQKKFLDFRYELVSNIIYNHEDEYGIRDSYFNNIFLSNYEEEYSEYSDNEFDDFKRYFDTKVKLLILIEERLNLNIEHTVVSGDYVCTSSEKMNYDRWKNVKI